MIFIFVFVNTFSDAILASSVRGTRRALVIGWTSEMPVESAKRKSSVVH